jgi:hypothetical protein
VLTVWYLVVFHEFWSYPDSVVLCYYFVVFLLEFGTVLTVWYLLFFYRILELSWQCGIMLFFYCNCPDSVVFCCFSWILELSWQCVILLFYYWILVLSWHCGIMLFFYWNCPESVVLCYCSIGTVLTVWYFVVFHRCWNGPESVVFCCFSEMLELFWQCVILLFFYWILELSWHCGIMLFFYWNCPDSVVLCYFSIGTVLTVWYFVVFHRCWKCPDSAVFCCFS